MEKQVNVILNGKKASVELNEGEFIAWMVEGDPDMVSFKTEKECKEYRTREWGSLYKSETEMDKLIPVCQYVFVGKNGLEENVPVCSIEDRIEKTPKGRGKYEYNGENISFYITGALVPYGNGLVCGDNLFITNMNGKTYENDITNMKDAVWVMNQNDDFQNINNFVKGVEYIDKYATPTVRQKCFDLLLQLREGGLDIMDSSKRVAFFCEVGVWKDSNRNPQLYHKDFRKYLWNCRWNYNFLEESGMIVTPVGNKVAWGTAN